MNGGEASLLLPPTNTHTTSALQISAGAAQRTATAATGLPSTEETAPSAQIGGNTRYHLPTVNFDQLRAYREQRAVQIFRTLLRDPVRIQEALATVDTLSTNEKKMLATEHIKWAHLTRAKALHHKLLRSCGRATLLDAAVTDGTTGPSIHPVCASARIQDSVLVVRTQAQLNRALDRCMGHIGCDTQEISQLRMRDMALRALLYYEAQKIQEDEETRWVAGSATLPSIVVPATAVASPGSTTVNLVPTRPAGGAGISTSRVAKRHVPVCPPASHRTTKHYRKRHVPLTVRVATSTVPGKQANKPVLSSSRPPHGEEGTPSDRKLQAKRVGGAVLPSNLLTSPAIHSPRVRAPQKALVNRRESSMSASSAAVAHAETNASALPSIVVPSVNNLHPVDAAWSGVALPVHTSSGGSIRKPGHRPTSYVASMLWALESYELRDVVLRLRSLV